MTVRILGGILLIVILFCGFYCNHPMGWSYRITGTVDEDGNWLQAEAKEFYFADTYVSDELAIRCSQTLSKSDPFTFSFSDPFNVAWTRIIPDSLVIAGGDFISVDTVAEKIYFCANKDLYSCNYRGDNLLNHTLDIGYTFIKPVLSADRRYITMLSLSSVNYGGKLNRYDLQTGEFVHLEQAGNAKWAAYNPGLDKFYYFTYFGALHSIKPDGNDPASHFAGFTNEAAFYHSTGDRYVLASGKTSSEGRTGMVFDISTGEISQIENLDRMVLNPCKNELTYSIRTEDKAELHRRDLNDGSDVLIHSGRLKKPDKIVAYPALHYRQDGGFLIFTAIVETIVQEGPYGK